MRKRSELATLRKEQSDAYRAKLKEYHAAKKATKETGEKIDVQMPAKQKIKQFGTSFKTEEEANAHRDKILEAKQEDKTRSNSKRSRLDAAK